MLHGDVGGGGYGVARKQTMQIFESKVFTLNLLCQHTAVRFEVAPTNRCSRLACAPKDLKL